jgi:hypothetical protein
MAKAVRVVRSDALKMSCFVVEGDSVKRDLIE